MDDQDKQLLSLFLDHLTLTRGLSANTRTAYEEDLRHLDGFLEKGFQEIGKEDLRRYLAHLLREGYARATMRRRWSCLRSFYGFLETRGLISANPSLGLSPSRMDRPLP